jgi:Holliday junction resolvase RusA-like endonuclease
MADYDVAAQAFTVYCTPTPQGSKRGWVIPGKNGAKPRAIVADANNKTKPYRQLVTQTVIETMQRRGQESPWAVAKVPVWLTLNFYVSRPQSAKKRICPSVKPDIDKLARSTMDALTGLLFADDAQVVELNCSKNYGTPERVEIVCRRIECETIRPISDEVKHVSLA